MEQGTVVKIHSNYYYVLCGDSLLECFLRGRLKKEKKQVMVGDNVCLQLTGKCTGVIEDIKPRKSCLKRPAAANLDQVIIVFSVKNPEPNTFLLDKFLVLAEEAGLEIIICWQKADLLSEAESTALGEMYRRIGYPVLVCSAKTGYGLDQLRDCLKDKLSVFAGPSGVGKSALLNSLEQDLHLKTGELSAKIQRGKHTTRHVELLPLRSGGLVVDAPGFSSLDLSSIKPGELAKYFPDLRAYISDCPSSCLHEKEKSCAVREAVESGKIDKIRYEHYLKLLNELRNAKGVRRR